MTKAGNIEGAQAVDAEAMHVNMRLDTLREEEEASASWFCKVIVSSSAALSVHEHRKGAERLSGGYRPIFEGVAEEVEGMMFTRVPWSKSPTNQVTAETSGCLYVFSISKETKVVGEVKKEAVTGLISGPHLGKVSVFRVTVKRGETFTCQGGECGVIARAISLK
jgi:hypothetical protein